MAPFFKQQLNPQMKLPKLNLLTFDVDLLHQQIFWDIFESTVHQQDISNFKCHKVQLLKNSLWGAASLAICEVSVTNDNYLMVIELLKEKFGISKQLLRNCILSYNIFLLPLNNIPKSNIPMKQLRRFKDSQSLRKKILVNRGLQHNRFYQSFQQMLL